MRNVESGYEERCHTWASIYWAMRLIARRLKRGPLPACKYVFYMLDEAIDLLSPAKLAKLVSRYLDVKQLRPDAVGKKSLLADVRVFETASRAGKYYESFNVNSKNFMDKSTGTRAFIADCDRLLDRCVTLGDVVLCAGCIRLQIHCVCHGSTDLNTTRGSIRVPITPCRTQLYVAATRGTCRQAGATATLARSFMRCR